MTTFCACEAKIVRESQCGGCKEEMSMTYICPRHPCGAHTGGCSFPDCPQHGYNWPVAPISFPSPRVVPVYMQLPSIGFTIAVMDRDGNVIIKTDQPLSPFDPDPKPTARLETAVQEVQRLRLALAEIADDEDTDTQTAVFAKNTLAIDRIAP